MQNIVDYKKDDYHKARHPELIESPALQRAWSDCAKYFYFKHVGPHQTVFEFGGGLGANLISMTTTNVCHMLEPSPVGRANAAGYGITTYETVDEIGSTQFDAILCRHVLEHVDHPLQTLVALKALTRPGGRLTLVLPVEPPDMPPVAPEVDFHLYTWNPRTIGNLLNRAGIQVHRYHFNYFNARRRCLPIHKHVGTDAYVKAVQTIGRLTGARELVVECQI